MPIIAVEEYRKILPLPKLPEPERQCSYEIDTDIITLVQDDAEGLEIGLVVMSEDFPEGTEILEIDGDTIKVSENALATGTGIIEFFGVNKEEDERIQMFIDVAEDYIKELCDNDKFFEDNGYPLPFKFIIVKAANRMMENLTRDNNIQSERLARYSVTYRADVQSDIMFDSSDLKIIKKYSRAGLITFKNAYRGV